MVEKGWIKLHRKIYDCWIWQEKPFDKGRAWIDLLLLAMHRDKKLLIDNEVLVIPRGSYMTSILKLAERWGWSRCKVMRFLNLLENEQMLNTKRTPKGTLVTIVKYEEYQIIGTTDDTTVDTSNETPSDTTDETPHETQKKNIKNIYKNDKEYSVQSVDFEKAWNKTVDRYPKKRREAMAKQIWLRRLLAVPEGERQQLATDIYQCIKLYLDDYRESKPDDAKYEFVPKFDEWLEQDCDYWLRQLENARAGDD